MALMALGKRAAGIDNKSADKDYGSKEQATENRPDYCPDDLHKGPF